MSHKMLSDFQLRVLTRLTKQGPMLMDDIRALWGNVDAIPELVALEYVAVNNGVYVITPKGKTHKQPLHLIGIKREEHMTTETTKQAVKAKRSEGQTKTYQILEKIEKAPRATAKDLGYQDLMNYLKSYINRGLVILDKNDTGTRTYMLKKGMTAKDVYSTRLGGENYRKPVPEALTDPNPLQDKHRPDLVMVDDYIPEFLRKDTQANVEKQPEPAKEELSDLIMQRQIDYVESKKPTPTASPAQSGSFRVAYTNDGCLMLLGLDSQPIELNAAQTNDLVEFISEQIMPIGVALQ